MALKHVWMRLRDRLRFAWAKSKYDFVPQGQSNKFSFDNCHHIVVLKLDGKLGDTQVMTHFYSALRSHDPRILLSVVCTPNLAEIYRDILGFDYVLTASRKPKFKEIQALCEELHSKNPVSILGSFDRPIDLVITTEPNFRPRDFIFNYLLQPRYVAGCETRADSVNLILYDPKTRTKKVAECFMDFMDKGHLNYGKLQYTRLVTPASLLKMSKWLYLPTATTAAANELEHEENMPNPRDHRFLLAINPRASSASRSFRDDFVVSLIQHLQAKLGTGASKDEIEAGAGAGMGAGVGAEAGAGTESADGVAIEQGALETAPDTPVLTERDLEFVVLTPPQATELKAKIKAAAVNCGAAVFFLPDDSTALDLSTTIDLCDALITVDTAAVHMACASQKPQLCVYTGTDLNESLRWAPIGDLAEVVRFEGQTVPEISDDVLLQRAHDFVQKLI